MNDLKKYIDEATLNLDCKDVVANAYDTTVNSQYMTTSSNVCKISDCFKTQCLKMTAKLDYVGKYGL